MTYRSPDGVPVLRSEVTLRNEGQATLHLESVSSLVVGCLTPDGPSAVDVADLLWAENDWLSECRWQRQPMRLTSPAHRGRVSDVHGKAGLALNGQGTWSSCGHLPMGGLTDRRSGRTWVWQIEHNGGGWRWECGERDKAAYTALFGPTDTHHGWRHPLEPGSVFRTVPAALSFSADGGPDAAFAALTRYRRAHRRPRDDHQRLPVIFNDYMNCLMGDPTTDKLLPLIDAAADAGAEYFVIDAGWYDDDNGGWWSTVGAWEPAASRFPGEKGIHEVLDRIREHGMVPGLWLEPEVIGVRSPMAGSLPDEAFFRRDGVRISEVDRHHLDLRHPAARLERRTGGRRLAAPPARSRRPAARRRHLHRLQRRPRPAHRPPLLVRRMLRTLAGLTSRCRVPTLWPASSASISCRPAAVSCGASSPTAVIRWASEGPSTSSMPIHSRSSDSTRSWTPTTWGCGTRATARASRMVRRIRTRCSSSTAVRRCSSLAATGRSRSWSWARQTVPMPPLPVVQQVPSGDQPFRTRDRLTITVSGYHALSRPLCTPTRVLRVSEPRSGRGPPAQGLRRTP